MINKIKYSVETARDGNPTLVAYPEGRGVYIHSKMNPHREGELVTDIPDPSRYDLLIVLGCGLGYTLLGIKNTLPQYTLVLIVDILEGIEKKIAENPLTSFIAESGNVKFFSGLETDELEENISALINLDTIKGIKLMEHTQSVRVFRQYYEDVKERIGRIIDRKAGSRATINAFGRLFLNNALNNIGNMKRCYPVSGLEEKFRGRKAVIVSSAPSFESIVNDLKACQQKVYIIAVDSALPVLRYYGIRPDFVVSIDPQPRIGEHFLGHEPSGILHIFSLVSPPVHPARFGGFISLNSHPVSQVIDDIFPGAVGSVDSSTGSVAGDAFMFAVKAGFEYIAMTGFDFSFSRNIIYARGTAYQNRYSLYFSNRFRTPETFNAEYIFKASGSLVADGRYTRRSFIGYRDSLDSLIAKSGFKNIYMLNRNGLALSNAGDSDIGSFIALPQGVNENKRDYIGSLRFKSLSGVIDAGLIAERLSDKKVLDELIMESLGNTGQARAKKFEAVLDSIYTGSNSRGVRL